MFTVASSNIRFWLILAAPVDKSGGSTSAACGGDVDLACALFYSDSATETQAI